MMTTQNRAGFNAIVPQFLAQDLEATSAFYREQLGFAVDFVYGETPFYAGVVRDGITLHLKHSDEAEPNRQFRVRYSRLKSQIVTAAATKRSG